MNLLPYHRFEITSPLKRQDALAAMAAHVEPARWFLIRWSNSANDKRFTGDLTIDGFRVTRIMGYRNSFAPVVLGEVHAAGATSRIVVTMRPMIFVIVFCAVWCAMVLLSLTTAGDTAWLALFMFAVLYAMVMGGFWFEANRQERVLREIFKGL